MDSQPTIRVPLIPTLPEPGAAIARRLVISAVAGLALNLVAYGITHGLGATEEVRTAASVGGLFLGLSIPWGLWIRSRFRSRRAAVASLVVDGGQVQLEQGTPPEVVARVSVGEVRVVRAVCRTHAGGQQSTVRQVAFAVVVIQIPGAETMIVGNPSGRAWSSPEDAVYEMPDYRVDQIGWQQLLQIFGIREDS